MDLTMKNTGGETVPSVFEAAVREHAERRLIVSGTDGSAFTYADAGEIVRRVASRLAAEGVKKGDAICVFSPAHAEAFLLFWAAASLGAVFVPLDFTWPERLAGRVFSQVRPKLLFCDRERFGPVSSAGSGVPVVLFDGPDEGKHSAPVFSGWIGTAAETVFPEVAPDDPAAILYTSGSTGEPKGVILSHGSLCRSGMLMKELFRWTPDDVLLNLGDLHAMSGFRNPALAALQAGCSFITASPEIRSNLFLLPEFIRKHGCTVLGASPVVIRKLMQFRDRIDVSSFSSLRSIISTGSALPQDVLDGFCGHFRVPVLNYYGLTETTGLCIGHSLETFPRANGSIGLPAGCAVRIVDGGGDDLPDGAAGELLIRSANLFSGYYGAPELSAGMLRDGWLCTGDVAMRRPDGHIVLQGRLRNIIKTARLDLVHLEEVEAVLERHPLVREAAVCGYDAERGDERMAAFIVPASSPARQDDFIRDVRRHVECELGPHKTPALYFLKDELPRTGAGKLLRERLKGELGRL